MNGDLGLGLLVLVSVTAGTWAAAFALRRVARDVTIRGFRNGTLIAAVLFALTVVVIAFVFNGRAVFLVTLDLAGAIELGLLVGAVVALGYLWLGGLLIAIGLIFRSKPQWTTLGAWAAVPVIVVAAGFGYTSYRSFASEGAATSTANGSISVNLSGSQTGRISAQGAASCATDSGGTLTIQTGTAADPHIITTDGRLTQVQISMNPDTAGASLDTFTITGIDAVPESITPASGQSPNGQLLLRATGWTGTISWSCNQ